MSRILVILLFCYFGVELCYSQHSLRCGHYGNQPNFSDWLTKSALNTRSDTTDIIHYQLNINLTDFVGHNLSGIATIALRSKMDNVGTVYFDLSNVYNINEVLVNNTPVEWLHDNDLLSINLGYFLLTGEEAEIRIEYSGVPADPGNSFGGFYFNNTYAYNLGIGIGVDPPSVGRTWYPCFDNFVERATYTFIISTPSDKKAYCNGLLTLEEEINGHKRWTWEMNQTIPAYLSSVAVAAYTDVNYIHNGLTADIPVILAALPIDTTTLKTKFTHLPDAITGFENAFGAYPFDRVGYALVPFNYGAMEHAGNIAYPRNAVISTGDYEELMAHEFAHSWWGDHITCEDPSQMWINEGWASYCSKYFHEFTYGVAAYKDAIRAHHYYVLRRSHLIDGAYYAVNNIPFDYTYGSTVYDKGADVIHTLRGYLGDTHFFNCSEEIQNAYAFSSINTDQLSDAYSDCSGMDMEPFSDYWLNKPGFPHFSIDSLVVHNTTPPYQVSVYIRQRLVGTDDYYEQVPLDLTIYSIGLNENTWKAMVSGPCTEVQFTTNDYPLMATLDKDEKIGDATLDGYVITDDPGSLSISETKCELEIESISDSTFVRVQHHLIMPDRALAAGIENLFLSPNRYWSLEILNGSGTSVDITAEFLYNGTTDSELGYLDNPLGIGSENNLRLMYRARSNDPWSFAPSTTQNIGNSPIDKIGSFTVINAQAGEYAIAKLQTGYVDNLVTVIPASCATYNIVSGLGDDPLDHTTMYKFSAYPNPVKNEFEILGNRNEIKSLQLYNTLGQLVKIWDKPTLPHQIISDEIIDGLYLLNIRLVNGGQYTIPLVIEN